MTTTVTLDFEVKQGQPGGDVELVNDTPCAERPMSLTLSHEEWVGLGNPNTVAITLETKCDGCGCTDSEACIGGCSWAAPALCSRCV